MNAGLVSCELYNDGVCMYNSNCCACGQVQRMLCTWLKLKILLINVIVSQCAGYPKLMVYASHACMHELEVANVL